jgi:hypothetical protein
MPSSRALPLPIRKQDIFAHLLCYLSIAGNLESNQLILVAVNILKEKVTIGGFEP